MIEGHCSAHVRMYTPPPPPTHTQVTLTRSWQQMVMQYQSSFSQEEWSLNKTVKLRRYLSSHCQVRPTIATTQYSLSVIVKSRVDDKGTKSLSPWVDDKGTKSVSPWVDDKGTKSVSPWVDDKGTKKSRSFHLHFKYGKRETVAYAASRLPAVYGTTLRVLTEVSPSLLDLEYSSSR